MRSVGSSASVAERSGMAAAEEVELTEAALERLHGLAICGLVSNGNSSSPVYVATHSTYTPPGERPQKEGLNMKVLINQGFRIS